MPYDERTPMLQSHASNFWSFNDGGASSSQPKENFHDQFCKLVGIPPSDLPPDADEPPIGPKTLYGRALKLKRNQNFTYGFTAGLSNTLLLTQVVLGAALTALGASQSSHILITIFGVLNTIIAGLVAYLKSRGQPMRARMYRDDLERVVDEIENSEIMWLGISKRVHGYDDINTESAVTVRSEVARLTRLYDRAVRSNTMNNPDMYLATGGNDTNLGLKNAHPPLPSNALAPALPVPPASGTPAAAAPAAPAPAPAAADPDESPATAPKPPSKEEPPKEDAAKADDKPKEDAKPAAESSKDAPKEEPKEEPKKDTNGAKPIDPDESPATSAAPPK